MPRKTKENKGKKKQTNKNNSKVNEVKNTNDNKFNFDEEIVIGLRRLDEPTVNDNTKKKKKKANKNNSQINNKTYKKNQKKRNNKKTNKKNLKNTNDSIESNEPEILIKSKYMQNYEEPEEKPNKKKQKNKKKNKKKPPKKLTKKQELSKKRRKVVFKILKWLTLIAIIIGGIIYALLSPIFNILQINVEGNSKISTEKIISLSELSTDENIFNYRTSYVEELIKREAYIDTVEVKRKLPNTVEITVTEREATFKLNYGNAYAYINNQGYILEITSVKGTMPLITGYSTDSNSIVAGNRLCTEDLEKLDDVLKIMEAASSVDDELRELIKEIDISDENNYILELTSEKKTVYLGEASKLSTKMLWINQLLETEDGVEGTIMLNVDLNTDMPYFNENV